MGNGFLICTFRANKTIYAQKYRKKWVCSSTNAPNSAKIRHIARFASICYTVNVR